MSAITKSAALALAPLLLAAAPAPAPVTPAELSATVKEIASDPYQGRAPGTPGESRTIAYLVARLKALGLQPAAPGGGWTQTVPMIHDVSGAPTKLAITVRGKALSPIPGTDIAPGTTRATRHVAIADAQMVFVGYGVSAPERGWDDFKGVDLHGKIAIFLVNDPDYAAKPGDDAFGKFGGAAMTYYGRWTYKYEEAARRGAIGALIVHETGAAGYGWNVAGNTVGGTYALPVEPGAPQPVAVQSWIAMPFAKALFAAAGLDLDALSATARSASFHPVTLDGARFAIDMPVASSAIESHNVLAKIPGTTHADETVLFGAHWDAYGVGAPDAQGRTIRPGANDDGLGVASLLALARAYKAGPAPQRTIGFGFWTAEERGLLGSEYYAQHPAFALPTTVANLTIDILQTAGPSRDVVLIGAGQDSLDGDLATAAAAQGRVVTPDAKPERGLVYRADHFSLAKRGVPTLLLMGAGGGVDLVAGGRTAGDAWVSDYTAHCYHQTCDTWSAGWDLRGATADVNLFYAIGAKLAGSRAWPTWNATSEFKPVRDETAAARKQ
ncbi:M28 family peptidase [uncultured Sphingomonas sp.]|uniref:M28 family peptidase n=1 Tax=uncultured Sphingomonas sp. TaxID=158754 RepID=UPI00261119BC|nr:M28 family peptidase [uncultured Sphingomonas sp.]